MRWPSVGEPMLRPNRSAAGPHDPALAVEGCLGTARGNAPLESVSVEARTARARDAARTMYRRRARPREEGQLSARGRAFRGVGWGILRSHVPTDSLFPSSRFSVSERRAMLMGRVAEMRELERAYGLARDRKQARMVTVLAPTGIGKTRLVRDFLVKSRESGQAPRVFRGTAREGGPAYEVFARILRARFGIVEGMDPEAAKAQVRAQVASVLDDRKVGDVAYFLGQLLDLEFQDSPLIKAVEGDAQQLRSMRRAVIKSFLETDAAKGAGPVVLVFDDLHWAHDDSMELLTYLVESLRGAILVICIARPEMLVRRDGWKRHGRRSARLRRAAPAERPRRRGRDAGPALAVRGRAGGRGARRRSRGAGGRQPGAPRADRAHLPRHGRPRGDRRLRGRAVERPRREARSRQAPAQRRGRRAGAHRGAGARGAGGTRARGRHGRRLLAGRGRRDAPAERVAAGGVGGRGGGGRRPHPAAPRGPGGAGLRAPLARQHVRRGRGVRLQAQPGARGARAPDASGRRAPLPPRHRRLARVPGEQRLERGVPRDAGSPPREGRRHRAGRVVLRARGRRGALPVRELQGVRALCARPRAARTMRSRRRGPPPGRAAPLGRRAPVAGPQRRGVSSVRRDAHAGVAAGSPEQGRRRALPHRTPLSRDRAPSRTPAGSSRPPSRSSVRPRTSAGSRARWTTSGSSTGSRGTTRSPSSTRCGGWRCGARWATGGASPSR